MYKVSFADGEVLRFRYRVVQLNRLPWRRFLKSDNPVAGALMAKMKIADRDRPRVKLECLRLLVTNRLDPSRTHLIARFVDAYLNLNSSEEQRLQKSLAAADLLPEQREEVVELLTSWERKGMEKGLAQGFAQGREEWLESGRHEGALWPTRRVNVRQSSRN